MSRMKGQLGVAASKGRALARRVLKEAKEIQKWAGFLASEDERIRLDAMKYLSDRAYGKAIQVSDVTVSGEVAYSMTASDKASALGVLEKMKTYEKQKEEHVN